MGIDEAIAKYRAKAELSKYSLKHFPDMKEKLEADQEEFSQIVKWLMELRRYKRCEDDGR